MNPLISIIMPVYQAEKYLHYSIPSVLQQTYSNIELILVNDGSTDQSASICDAFAAKDARIKVMHTTNNGQASARNRGIEIASGDFLGFIDNDDELFPDMCERLVANIKRESADISGASFIQKDESGHITRDNHNPENYYVWENEEAMSNFLERKRMDIYVWTKIYRREFLNNNAIRFREGIKSDEDVLFNFEAFKHAKKVVMQDVPIYIYAHRTDSACRSLPLTNLVRYLEGMLYRTSYIEDGIKKHYPSLLPLAKRQTILYSFIMIGYAVRNPYTDSASYFKQIVNYLHDNKKQVINERFYWSMSYIGVWLATHLPNSLYFYYRSWKDGLKRK